MTPVVLVVEEQQVLRERYARHLREEGYRVVATRPTGDLASLLTEVGPDLIVLDPECAGGRGMAIALEALRADPGVAVVFNTSDPRHLETDFSSWVADAYTVRSHGVAGVRTTVRRLLRRMTDRRAGHPGASRRVAPSRPRAPSRA